MLTYQQMNSAQRNAWNRMTRELMELNQGLQRIKKTDLRILEMVRFYKQQTGKDLPVIAQNMSFAQSLTNRAIELQETARRLNFAYSMVLTGSALLQESKTIPNDFDVYAGPELNSRIIQESMFPPPGEPIGVAPIIPLVITAVVVLGTALIVRSIVVNVTETVQKQQKLELDTRKLEASVEKGMAQDSDIFRMWSDFKAKTFQPISEPLSKQIQGIGGGLITIAAVGLGAYFLFSAIGKRRSSNV